MIDTHCHLTDLRLFEQLNDVIARAHQAGVTRLITIGTDLEDDIAAVGVCTSRENIWCAIGVHPNHGTPEDIQRLPQLRGLAQNKRVVAIGEMGLDYHYDRVPRDLQATLFEAQLQLATELKLPVVIHCREAVADTLAILRNHPTVHGVFHCFTGSVPDVRQIIATDFHVGFTGPVTYKRSDELRQAAALVPIDRLVVETDAPYLSPEPMRKFKTNEPAWVMHTAAMIAQVKSISLEDLDTATTANAERLFGLNQ